MKECENVRMWKNNLRGCVQVRILSTTGRTAYSLRNIIRDKGKRKSSRCLARFAENPYRALCHEGRLGAPVPNAEECESLEARQWVKGTGASATHKGW